MRLEDQVAAFRYVYFQTSREITGYFVPDPAHPGSMIYDATQVPGYANSLITVRPAGMVGNCVPYQGVSADGLDFDYIPNVTKTDAAGATGTFWGYDQALLQTAVQGMSSGRTYGKVFCEAIGMRFQQDNLRPNLAAPILFSVIDHNSCHHFSVPLIALAFQSVPAGMIKIVINVDYHTDFGSATIPNPPQLQCSTWGVWTVSPVPGLYPGPITDVYIHAGAPVSPPGTIGGTKGLEWRGRTVPPASVFPNNAGLAAAMPPAAQLAVTVPPNPSTDPTNLLTYLGGLFAWNNAYVYVSVDRDFMAGSFTPYNTPQHDGFYANPDGRTLVQRLLTGLQQRGAHLVGFDTAGLPANSGATKTVPPAPPPTPAAILAQAAGDIQAFANAVSAF